LDTFAEVFLNEQSVLRADNMFRSWRIPAKALLKPGANTLRIVFRSPVTSMIPRVRALPYQLPSISTVNAGNEENIATAPYTRKAAYQYGWDWGPRYVTIGIWKPVRLEAWDAVRIANFHIHQLKVDKDVATLAAELELDSSGPSSVSITVSERDSSGKSTPLATQTLPLDPGNNNVSLPLRLVNPKLWYPAGYGAQDRYQFSVRVRLGKEFVAASDLRTGLRSVELRRAYDPWGKSFTFVVNGIPVFAKGANVIPFDSFPSRVTPEVHRTILQAARDTNMNMVREWGGGIYESDDFYDICDELGLMVWQEFAFGGDMVPGDLAFQENVREEAIQQVRRLRDHPSIVLWCGNNEIETGWDTWADRIAFRQTISPLESERVWQDYVVLFHDIIKSVVTQYAAPTPYWPSSPSANFEEPANSQDNGDMHYWGVWHSLEPLQNYMLQTPRFMSEFGFQSFPELASIQVFATPGDLGIDTVVMKSHQKNHGGNERILTYMLREYPEPASFPAFVYLSQVQQAEAIKLGAEHLRRNRPRVMGSLYWQLNDCWPVASWSSIDYFGRWKALQYYARRFYSDLPISPSLHDGAVDIYVVSDKLQPVSGQVRLRVLDFNGKILFQKVQAVDVPAQSSAVYFSIGKNDLIGSANPDQVLLSAELMVGDVSVSRNLVFFDNMRNLDLPLKPAIESQIGASQQGYTITLRSPVLARNVFVSFDLPAGGNVQLSDNYFDLLPGESATLVAKTSATLDQLKRGMRLTSLTDAFSSSRPAYRSPRQ
jgi:beta-mannosidase